MPKINGFYPEFVAAFSKKASIPQSKISEYYVENYAKAGSNDVNILVREYSDVAEKKELFMLKTLWRLSRSALIYVTKTRSSWINNDSRLIRISEKLKTTLAGEYLKILYKYQCNTQSMTDRVEQFAHALDCNHHITLACKSEFITVFFKDNEKFKQVFDKRISAVMPAFNEENTVKESVLAVCNSPLVDEVICVNDGSTDNTAQIIKEIKDSKVMFIDLKDNMGKGFAVAQAVKKASCDLILMMDTDVSNIHNSHIEHLISPLLFEGLGVRATIGFFGNRPELLTSINGERAYFKKDMLEIIDEIEGSKYGIETILNKRFKGLTALVPLPGFVHYEKFKKNLPYRKLITDYYFEGLEIAQLIIRSNIGKVTNSNAAVRIREMLR